MAANLKGNLKCPACQHTSCCYACIRGGEGAFLMLDEHELRDMWAELDPEDRRLFLADHAPAELFGAAE